MASRKRGLDWTPPPPEPWELALPDGEGPVELGPRYLRAIAALEALPENRSGADKAWVHSADRLFRWHFARVSRVT